MSDIGKTSAKDINLKDFINVLKKRAWIIIVFAVLATLAGYFMSSKATSPLYQSSTRIIIGSEKDLMNTLIVMVKDPIIMEIVGDKLKLTNTPESIANQVEVTRIDESQVVLITTTANDSKLAADIANMTAKTFKSEIGNILEFDDVQLLSAAIVNPNPINVKNQTKTIVIGLVFGIIAGIGFAFLIDSLDETISKESDLERILGVPVIGTISNMKMKKLTISKSSVNEKIELRGDTVGIHK